MKKITSPKYKLAASLICGNFLELKKDIIALKKGRIDYFHIDVMDGIFVPRYGLFPEIITQIRTICDTPLDIHMMIENAENYIDTFVKAGANKKEDMFIVHTESTKHIDRVIRKIKDKGIKAGVALNPGTSLSALDYVLPNIDAVLLMAINPGIIDHKLIPEILDKISHLKEKLHDYPHMLIGIDGGINFENAPGMLKAGATLFVCGSQTIFRPKEATIDKKINQLRKILDNALI